MLRLGNGLPRFGEVSAVSSRWVLACLLLASLPARAAEPPRLALVIGNGAYRALPPLPSCSASARIVAATLQRAGFTVREQPDESNGRLGAAISDFADALAAAPGAVAVFYYCGYAAGFNGRVFLLPTPATLERPTDALTQGIVARLPVRAVTGAPVRAGLILMDAVMVPGAAAPIPFGTLLDGGGADAVGFVGVQAAGSAPQGPTTLAVALSAALAQQPAELKAIVQTLRGAFAGPQAATIVVQEPATPVLLAGDAPAVAAAPPPPSTPTPAPTPPPPTPPPPPAPVAAPAPLALPVPAETPAWTPSIGELRRGQLALQRLGYFRGSIDGVLGPLMVAAIKRYQSENRMEPTGRLTEEQFGQLLQDGR